MPKQIRSKEIKEAIELLGSNIKSLKEAEEVNIKDIQGCLIDLMEIVMNMWEDFAEVFDKIKELMKVEEANEKGEIYKDEVSKGKNDIKRMFV